MQEYCMYFKLLQRTFGEKAPPAAAGAFNQCFLKEVKDCRAGVLPAQETCLARKGPEIPTRKGAYAL